jgi:hypothetical protein
VLPRAQARAVVAAAARACARGGGVPPLVQRSKTGFYQSRLYHVQRADAIKPIVPEALRDHVSGLRRATLVGRHVGAVHTGFALVELEPGGRVQTHLHSTEQSFYVLAGHPTLSSTAGRTAWRPMSAACSRSASPTRG